MKSILVLTLLASQLPPTFRSDVHLVTVDVQVVEKGTGAVIDVLGPADFVISDEGEPREVKLFQIETVPLDVVFLHYTQGLVTGRADVEQLLAGLRAAVSELRPGDRAAVLRTHESAKADLAMTGDLPEVERALTMPVFSRKASGRGDRLFDAVRAATELFPNRAIPHGAAPSF